MFLEQQPVFTQMLISTPFMCAEVSFGTAASTRVNPANSRKHVGACGGGGGVGRCCIAVKADTLRCKLTRKILVVLQRVCSIKSSINLISLQPQKL